MAGGTLRTPGELRGMGSTTFIAPALSLKPQRTRMNVAGAVRLANRHDVGVLANHMPFAVNVFDTTLGANLSGEDRATVQWKFWLAAIVASASAGSFIGSNQPFALQLFHSRIDPATGDQVGFRHQLIPVDAGNYVGNAQKAFYLRVPVFFDDATEILCRVQNLQNANNAIQVVLHGYIPG